ncbi:MAG TPA: hypothetical protein VFE02_16235, partial [Candidatus Acidoferrales bacterium]|nr:hypothetical protein [Candidatus Acidoferrales bacterium]
NGVIARLRSQHGFKISKYSWHDLRGSKPGNANLLIGVLTCANQEIGVPRKNLQLRELCKLRGEIRGHVLKRFRRAGPSITK